jgi:hypothetical protein
VVSISRLELQLLRQLVQHGAVHAVFAAATHLVPIVGRQLDFGAVHRDLDLGVGHQVVEAGLARDLLLQEPAHGLKVGLLGQPGEERVVLTRAVVLQRLEPTQDALRIGRRLCSAVAHLGPERLDECAFLEPHLMLVRQLRLPIRVRKAGRQPTMVPLRQPPMKCIVEGEMIVSSVVQGRTR